MARDHEGLPVSSRPPEIAEGRIAFWQTGSLWVGRGAGRSDWHAHHAIQLAFSREGHFRFRSAPDTEWRDYRAAVIPSNLRHEFEIGDAPMAHLFVEPETAAGRALAQRFPSDAIHPLPGGEADPMAALLFEPDASADAARLALGVLAAPADSEEPGDARIERALDFLRGALRKPIALADAARAVHLSPGRFRHLFVAETGSSFRAYLLWLRLNEAIAVAMHGETWTEAAHAAGFADSAHLSRTFRRMFGLNPATLHRVAAAGNHQR